MPANVFFITLLVAFLFSTCSSKQKEDSYVFEKKTKIPHQYVSNKNLLNNYDEDISRSLSILLEHKIIINKEFQNDKDKYNILAVAFPELIRYSAFSDLIETASNKLLYINGGKEAADYSIGYFQMKPSFIEQLEVCSKKYNYHTKFKSLLIDFRDIKKVRATRIQRLENIQWQIRYLKAYWSIMDEKYKTKTFLNIEEKIRFYATAYNYGFTKPDDEILAYQQVKAFPLGKNINNNQIAFSDFSIEFINNYSSKLNY